MNLRWDFKSQGNTKGVGGEVWDFTFPQITRIKTADSADCSEDGKDGLGVGGNFLESGNLRGFVRLFRTVGKSWQRKQTH